MSGVRTGALVRSIQAMTDGPIRAHSSAAEQYAAQRLGELDQQFHLPISGTAGQTILVQTVTVDFDAPFIDAYDERDSPYVDPTFTSGVVMTKGREVFFAVSVTRWLVEDGIYSGANIAVAAFCPVGTQDFNGEIHLNFQGYGSPTSDETDGDTNP